MSKFKIGDKVANSKGDTATVTGVSNLIGLVWSNGAGGGLWDERFFEKVKRSFAAGDFIRSIADDGTNGAVGMIIEDDGDPEDMGPYWVALFDKDGTEAPYSANELVPWFPAIGDRVLEANVEDTTGGNVIAISTDRKFARVLWDTFPHVQNFAIDDLEPEDDFEEDFEVGELVTYSNPIFSGTVDARVLSVEDNIIHVKFEPGVLIKDGAYSKDFFSKAA